MAALICLPLGSFAAPAHDETGHACGDCLAEPEPNAEPLQPSGDYYETYPDGSRPGPATEPAFAPMGVSSPIAAAMAGQPQGPLTGRIVYTSAGHGWTWSSNGWFLQRPVLLEMNEDYGTLDHMTMFAQYVFNAGATVVPMRPVGHQPNEAVVTNVDPGVSWEGEWNDSSSPIYYGNPGETAYRWTELSSTETATATYTPDIPESGFYPVYTWVRHGGNRTFQLYRIRHSGGESEVRIPHHKVGNGWVYLGTYYFEAGSNEGEGSVVISNLQPSPAVGSVVIADSIRFGNGMSNDGSTYPKEDEASRYWVKNSLGQGQDPRIYDRPGLGHQSDNVGTPPRMAREMNRAAASPLHNSVYLGFHTNASGGRGTIGLHNGNHPGASTPNQLRWAEIVAEEINDQMVALSPRLEVPWHNRTGSALTLSRSDIAFGEINNNTIQDEFNATIIEVAFHDDDNDTLLLRDPKVRNWSARASYHAVVRYMNEFNDAALDFFPEPPRNIRTRGIGPHTVEISWDEPAPSVSDAGDPDGYLVYRSTNGYGFGEPVNVDGDTTSVTLDSLPEDTDLYFRVSAVNAGGESFPSETAGWRSSSDPEAPRVLFVNGYTRFDRTINIRQTPQPGNYRPPGHDGNTGSIDRAIPRSTNSFDYVVQHGRAFAASGAAFDSGAKEAVENNEVDLLDYDAVVWAAGQNSVSDGTFNSAARNRISAFLDVGGAVFVSGSEIAYDLDRPFGPSSSERAFLRDRLRVRYNSGDAENYNVSPVAGTLFSGNPNAVFDDGGGEIYPVRSPDTVVPEGEGATAALTHTGGVGGVAAVQYDGSAGGGRTVFMAFPFETILDPAVRAAYMDNILEFLGEPIDDVPPTITAELESQIVFAGTRAVLSVSATGVPAPTYQWQRNGEDIEEATEASLTLDPIQLADAGEYRVIVSNTAGSVTSDTVTVQVHKVPDRPRFTNLQTGEQNQFESLFLGVPDTWYLVEASVDLVSWKPLTALSVGNAPPAFRDSDRPAFDRRYYRARETTVEQITDFESFSEGDSVLFQPPSHPGPTMQFIETGEGIPDESLITADPPESIDRSRVLRSSWRFSEDASDPWLRLTTLNAETIPNPTIDFSAGIRFRIYVDRPIYLVLGIRETDSTAAIGEDGGTQGELEWVGGRTDNTSVPPKGKFIPAGEWTTVHFFLPFEPVAAFTGNGILESDTGKGVLENLTIVPIDGAGDYNLYLDDLFSIEL